jgi:ABC-type transport system substrate-binding protein
LGAGLFALLLLGVACAGDAAPQVAQEPQQPAAAAAPAPAAAAPDPAAATGVAGSAPTRPAAMPAPSVPAATGEPKYGGTLILGHRQDPPLGFDTMRYSGVSTIQVAASIWGNGHLVKPCRENIFNVCPGLAESWEHNDDFTQWTFKVRDNVLWHDGTRMVPEDIKFWLELFVYGVEVGDKKRGPSTARLDFEPLESVEVLPGNQLRITLSSPRPQYLQVVSRPHYVVAHPRHLMESRIRQGDVGIAPLDVDLVGMGPFVFDRFDKGSRVSVRRYDNYWETDEAGRQLPYMDGIDFAMVGSPSAMDAAVRVGRLDGGARGPGYHLSSERQQSYNKDFGDDVWYAEVRFFNWCCWFNTLKEGPLQDVRVRKALSLWVDKRAAIPSVLGGFGYLRTLLDPDNPYTSPDFLEWPSYNKDTRAADQAEAKRLLAEAGYPDGFELYENCWRVAQSACEFLAGQFTTLGVNFNLKLVDTGTRQVTAATLDNDIDSASGWQGGFAIPEMIIQNLARYSENKRAGPKHEDPRIGEYFEELHTSVDLQKRIEVFRELERYVILEQVYNIPLLGELAVTPYRSYVKGYLPPAGDVNNNYNHARTWLDK